MLREANLSVYGHAHKPRVLGSLDDLFANITVLLPPDLLQQICIGILTNTSYDCLKNFLINFWKVAKTKLLTKVRGEIVTENVPPIIHVQAGKLKVVIPTNLEDNKFEYFVDRMFECITPETITEDKYAFYDNESRNITLLTSRQIAEKAMQEWSEKHEGK